MNSDIVSDFITEGVIIVRGEHIYINLTNPFGRNTYIFQLPKSLFCMMIKNRMIMKDISVWKSRNEKEKKEEIEQKKKLSKLGMYG